MALALDRYFTPRSMPETAETTKHRVRTPITATARVLLSAPPPKTSSSPPVICSAPRPSEVAEPKSVAKIAITSIAPADRSRRVIPEERPERAADQVPRALAVGEVADGQADDGVHRPGVEAPVEERVLHREVRRLRRTRLRHPERRVVEMGERLGDAPEHQADAHAGGEHHRHPGERRELRLGVVRSELQVAEAGERQVRREDHEPGTGQDEEPAERVGDPGQHLGRDLVHPVGIDDPGDEEGDGECGGDAEHHLVDRQLAVRVRAGRGHVREDRSCRAPRSCDLRAGAAAEDGAGSRERLSRARRRPCPGSPRSTWRRRPPATSCRR